MDAKELREKRIARLKAAGFLNKDSDQQKPTEPTTANTKPAEQTDSAPRQLTAGVVDPASVGICKELDFFTFNDTKHAATDDDYNPRVVIFANGQPVAEVHLRDQDEPQKIASVFGTPDYAEGLRRYASKNTLAALLNGINARMYVAQVAESDMAKQIEARVEKQKTEEFRVRSARIIDDFMNSLMMVAEAQRTNYIQEAPLKDALHEVFKKAGVADPVPFIEEACISGFADQFKVMIAQAQEWLSISDEARADIQKRIASMGHRMPTRAESNEPPPASSRNNMIPTARDNVPLVTAGAGQEQPEAPRSALKAAYTDQFNFRSRMLRKDMPVR